MPRGVRNAAVAAPSVPMHDPLAGVAADIENNLSYAQILANAGAFRDYSRSERDGQIVHKMPIGAPYRSGGKWVQQTKTYPVAMSAEEAREKTRATGNRWDWYSPGSDCPKCTNLIVGWCLGGRKFAQDHDHVTDFDPTLYGVMEVDPPSDMLDDEEAVEDERVLVEA